jgi:single-strand DNA-binding protein
MVNRVILIGRLGRDPEIRYTQSSMPVANFSLATNERWVGQDGNRQERTEWHNIVVFGKLADICGQFLKKGKLVFIEGRLQTREWDDRDGNKRRTTEVVANNMQMLDSRGGGEGDSEDSGESNRNAMEIGITDDDIPF